MKTLVVPAELDKLDSVIEFIEAEMESADCPMKVMMQVQLSVEEIYVNIAHYSGSEKAEIGVEADGEKRELTVILKDSGTPFDPLAKEDADTSLSADERKIGGLGILLVKKNMNKVSYVYENGMNCLTMVKNW